jgi:predicted dehydrogenase
MAGSKGDRLRVGIVGLRMGEDMLDALAQHPRTEVRALCDPLAERVRPLAEKYGVPGVYADYGTMLASEELDGVCISTPNHLHVPMVRGALARGLHVMCEKPLALEAADARSLLEAARAARVTHGVNFSNRSNPAVKYVKEQLEQGVCGRICEVHLTYLQDGLADPGAGYSWRNSRAASGSGALGDIGSHLLDLSRLFIGEVASISALLGIVTPERVRPDGTIGVVDADDLAYLHLRYATGAFGLLRVSRVAQGNGDLRRVELFGDRAALVLEIDDEINRVLRADAHAAWGGGFREVFAHDPRLSTWGINTLEWADAAIEGRETSPNFEDGLRSQEILDAAIRSHAERRWIDLAIS